MKYFLILPLLFNAVFAQIKLPAIISDHMVLQQKSKVALWGWSKPAAMVSVKPSWINRAIYTTADAKGRFEIAVKTPAAGDSHEIEFVSGDTIVVHDVVMGEVWLASGQSNMEFFMGKTPNASYTGEMNREDALKDADLPLIRTIDVPNRVSNEPQNEFKAIWKICSPATLDTFSAVAFYFARSIHKATGFPVGIINSTWGGTPAESWTKKEVLEGDPELSPILDRYEEQLKNYPELSKQYKLDAELWKADTSKRKGPAPVAPIGPTHNKSPYKLYNGMIAPLIPYTLKGAIWYQGESNVDRAFQYRTLFPAMIKQWRSDFKNEAMPFYFVQIAPHRSQSPEIRDAQLFTMNTVDHTGMAVITDYGNANDIHPRNKKVVGERLSLWALRYQYGQKRIEYCGPRYIGMKISDNSIVLHFDHAAGLQALNGPLKEFTIAGDDQKFIPANAVIEGTTIRVSAEGLSQPVAVRFAWSNVPQPNLYNGAGLPASPFKTDDWKQATEGKK